MIGVEGVMTAVVGELKAAMPGKLRELRVRYGVRDGSLEDIRTWLTNEPDNTAVDKPPMVVVVEQESDTVAGPVRVAGDGQGGATYRYRYRIAVFAWAVGVNYESTATARRRYGLAAREILLQRPGLGPVDDPDRIVIDPATLTETYSDVVRDTATREVTAATGISVEYVTQEYLGPRLAPVGVTAGGVVGVGVTP